MASLNKIKLPGGDYIDIDAKTLNGVAASSYLTTTTANNTYLKLSGGTLTGHLYLSSAQIYIKNSDSAILSGTTSTSSAAGTSMIGQARGTTTIRGFDDPIWRRYTNTGQHTDYTIYHSGNLTQSVVTGLIGSTTYAPYNADGYLPLSGGTMSGAIILSNATTLQGLDTGSTARTLLGLDASNNVNLAYGAAGAGYTTNVDGNVINFKYGTGHTTGMTLTSDGDVTLTNTLCLNNNQTVRWKDTSGNLRQCLQFNSVNRFQVGYGAAVAGYDTYINGNNIYFRYGTTPTDGAIITSSGNVGIGTDSPAYKLDVAGVIHASSNVTAGGNITATGYISSASYVNSLGLKFPTNANRTSINATGWYRVWTGGARDTFPTSIILNITKNSGGSTSEGYLIEIGLAGNGQVTFNQISGTTQTTTRNITKIRYVYVYNTAAPSTYIDIYYSGTAENNVNISGLSGHGTFSAPTLVENTTGYTTVEFETQRFAFKTTKAIVADGSITGASFIKTGGTSSQLLAADGSTRSITISSSEPTSSDGSDGDIWIVI